MKDKVLNKLSISLTLPGFDLIPFKSPSNTMKSYWNWENCSLLLYWIRKSVAGVFLSDSGWFHLWLLLAYPVHRIFGLSPLFLNLLGRVGGEGELDPSVLRPVLFEDPVFGFRVA